MCYFSLNASAAGFTNDNDSHSEGSTIMCRFGLFAIVPALLVLIQPPEGEKSGDQEKFPRQKVPPIVGTVELKNGTTVHGLFLAPKDLTVQCGDVGLVVLPLQKVRLIDLEAEPHLVRTHASDSIFGFLQT